VQRGPKDLEIFLSSAIEDSGATPLSVSRKSQVFEHTQRTKNGEFPRKLFQMQEFKP
jgi:hypothetical protein